MSEELYDEYPSLTLAKESQEQNIEPLKLGQRIKEVRSRLGITLEEASQRTGLARSTLSKIENEQISPTFQAMQKLAHGLKIDATQLSNKKMMPFKSVVHARTFEEYGDWVRHDGEEFLLILSGGSIPSSMSLWF